MNINQLLTTPWPPRTSEEEEMASSSSNTPKESVVVDCGRRRTSCGYCRSSRHNSISHGPFSLSLSLSSIQFFSEFSLLSFIISTEFSALYWIRCASRFPRQFVAFSDSFLPPIEVVGLVDRNEESSAENDGV